MITQADMDAADKRLAKLAESFSDEDKAGDLIESWCEAHNCDAEAVKGVTERSVLQLVMDLVSGSGSEIVTGQEIDMGAPRAFFAGIMSSLLLGMEIGLARVPDEDLPDWNNVTTEGDGE